MTLKIQKLRRLFHKMSVPDMSFLSEIKLYQILLYYMTDCFYEL